MDGMRLKYAWGYLVLSRISFYYIFDGGGITHYHTIHIRIYFRIIALLKIFNNPFPT